MRKSIKTIALLLCLLMAVLPLGACSNGGGTTGQTDNSGTTGSAGSADAAKPAETVEITQWVWDRGTIPADQGTLEDNWWTKYMNEAMAEYGIKVSYVITPRAQEAEMLSTMLAAGTAPDILHTNQAALVSTYINNGGIADLSSYMDEYGANLKELYGEEMIKWGMKGDKLYGFYHLDNGFLGTTWVRKDLLDKMGMDIPTNPEEYHEMLLAAKSEYPELGTFAFQGAEFAHVDTVVLGAFLKEEVTELDLWKPIMLVDDTKECLQYLNTLYNEGLIRDFLLDKDESLFKAAISNGELFSFTAAGHYPYHSAYGNLYDNLRKNQPEAEMVSIWPWYNSTLDKNYYYLNHDDNPMAGYIFCVPATSKHVKESVIYLNWLADMDEAYLPAVMGFEGVDYEWQDEFPAVIDEAHYKGTVTWIEPQYGTLGKAFASDAELFRLNYMKDYNKDYHEAILRDSKVFQEMSVLCPTITAVTEVYDNNLPTLKDLWKTAKAQLIMCAPDQFDALWDSFMQEYLTAGAEESWEDLQNAWKEMGN